MPRRGRSADRILSRQSLLAGGFILLSLAIVYLSARLLMPFLKALIWAAVIAILVYPLNRLVLRLTGGRRSLASLLVTGVVILGGAFPAGLLVGALAAESRDAYGYLAVFVKGGGPARIKAWLLEAQGRLIPAVLGQDLADYMGSWIRDLSSAGVRAMAGSAAHILNGLIGDIPFLALNLVVVLVTTFYFLRDGDVWLRKLKEAMPLAPEVRDLVMTQLTITVRAVIYGMLFTAVILGIMLSVGFKLFGAPLPVLFGVLQFFLAMIPLIGPMLLWILGSAWVYMADGDAERAIGLLVFGSVVVFLLDNFLRPYIIGGRARLPFLLLFLSIIGGLITYGALGIFLGPVLVAVGLAVAGTYREITLAGKTARVKGRQR
jgi:predicted PurR-regulated permease PerM